MFGIRLRGIKDGTTGWRIIPTIFCAIKFTARNVSKGRDNWDIEQLLIDAKDVKGSRWLTKLRDAVSRDQESGLKEDGKAGGGSGIAALRLGGGDA
jgi:hypothetical protein